MCFFFVEYGMISIFHAIVLLFYIFVYAKAFGFSHLDFVILLLIIFIYTFNKPSNESVSKENCCWRVEFFLHRKTISDKLSISTQYFCSRESDINSWNPYTINPTPDRSIRVALCLSIFSDKCYHQNCSKRWKFFA